MPPVLSTNIQREVTAELKNKDYGYTYPNGLDLRPGSELHERIKKEVWARANESFTAMSDRHEVWKRIDKTMTAYIDLDAEERRLKGKDARKPVSIVVPLSYATRDVMLTYLVTAFLDSPVFRYEGVGPEDQLGAMLLELLIDQHCQRKKIGLALHTMFNSALTYGIGPVSPIWDRRVTKRPMIVDEPILSQSTFEMIGTQKVIKTQDQLIESNDLMNIDPYSYLPDPNVPADQPQSGEYVGWVAFDNRMRMMRSEASSPNDWFNAKYLQHVTNGTTNIGQTRMDLGGGRDNSPFRRRSASNSTNPMDVIYMYVDLIPSDEKWKLGSGDKPEKWLFALAADSVIVAAKPLGLDHDLFPITVAAPEFDGHSMMPISRIELMEGSQTVANWYVNSHNENIRKTRHDMVVFDPSRINTNDVLNPAPGKLIRGRRAASGMDLRQSIFQLQLNDVTRNNISDVGFITDMIQRAVGAPDTLDGMRRQTSERVSATEARDTKTSALSRLEKMVKILSIQAMQDIGYQFASNTRQLLSQQTYVKMIGRNEEVLRDLYQGSAQAAVRPSDLIIDFDVLSHDGSINRPETLEGWMQMYQITAQNPLLMQSTNVVMMFKHIARLLGEKDPRQLMNRPIQTRVVPDAQAMAAAQSGQYVPVPQAAEGVAA